MAKPENFVTFLDNHDQIQRFNHPSTPQEQITMGLAVLFCLPSIPAIYYGTEQGLTGTVHLNGYPDLFNNKSVREALWGKPIAFDNKHLLYTQIKALTDFGRSGLRCDSAGFISARSQAMSGISAIQLEQVGWLCFPAS
jgi:Alpha amylase, catalytic domain